MSTRCRVLYKQRVWVQNPTYGKDIRISVALKMNPVTDKAQLFYVQNHTRPTAAEENSLNIFFRKIQENEQCIERKRLTERKYHTRYYAQKRKRYRELTFCDIKCKNAQYYLKGGIEPCDRLIYFSKPTNQGIKSRLKQGMVIKCYTEQYEKSYRNRQNYSGGKTHSISFCLFHIIKPILIFC